MLICLFLSKLVPFLFLLQQIYRSHQQALAGASPAANQGQQQSLALLQQQQQLFAQQQLAGTIALLQLFYFVFLLFSDR